MESLKRGAIRGFPVYAAPARFTACLSHHLPSAEPPFIIGKPDNGLYRMLSRDA